MMNSRGASTGLLHPTDFSPRGRAAFEHALAIALRTRRALTLLHVRDEDAPPSTMAGLKLTIETLIRWGRLPAGASLGVIERELGFDVTSVIIPGHDFRAAVLGYLEEHPYALAVMATREHRGLSHWIDTSMERRALGNVKTPILFLREGGRRGLIDGLNGDIKLARALIPFDGRSGGDASVQAIVDIVEDLSILAKCTLLHVGDAAPPHLPVKLPLIHRQGPLAETILQVARSERADLVAMPTAGRHGWLDALRGGVTAQILADAQWPLLSMPLH